MSNTIIKVEELGKKYILGQRTDGMYQYKTLRDAMANSLSSLSHGALSIFKNKREADVAVVDNDFWALRGVSFELQRGDRLGIVGRNGAGKSTLLKILSRITEPTKGKASIKGRIASLLEVGTGFHPELTGRENIFLNGAILGMRRKEISRKFDEIVAFAEIEKFLDTPVKRYSSGMYVRLAFAVAAHMEPEILVVDEVLAVGDSQFQNKCLGKMENVSRSEGRTILFVSHNMGALRTLCNRGLLLDEGKRAGFGDIEEIVTQYEKSFLSSKAFKPIDFPKEKLRLEKVVVNEGLGGLVKPYEPLTIKVGIHSSNLENLTGIGLSINLKITGYTGILASLRTNHHPGDDLVVKPGYNEFVCQVDSFQFCSDEYTLDVSLYVPGVKFLINERDLICFNVAEVMSKSGYFATKPIYGRVFLDYKWDFNRSK
jgi:lipopolysaccharide transport system ATP-binding protein